MLRITTIDKGQITIFRLAGRLVGDWVGELERCWVSTKSADSGRKLTIDMSDVEFVDEKGEALLERMFLQGAELRAGNLLMESVIAGIEEHSQAEHAGQSGAVQ